MTTSEYSGLDQLRVHLGPSLGAFWEAVKGPFTLRLRWEHDAYIQTADGTTLELKDQAQAAPQRVLLAQAAGRFPRQSSGGRSSLPSIERSRKRAASLSAPAQRLPQRTKEAIDPARRLLTADVADEAGITVETVSHHVRTGTLPAVQLYSGARLFFLRSEVDAWLATRNPGNPPT
jgi:predicted DNA-binding transcriptional regulator AlpA